MALTELPRSALSNQQKLQVPGGRIVAITGAVKVNLEVLASPGGTAVRNESYGIVVDRIPGAVQAIGTATAGSIMVAVGDKTFAVAVSNAQADVDDDSRDVRLSFDVALQSTGNTTLRTVEFTVLVSTEG